MLSISTLKNQGEEEQIKPKTSRRNGTITMGADWNEMENSKTNRKSMEQKIKFAKKLNKTEKYITRVTQEENDRSHILPISEMPKEANTNARKKHGKNTNDTCQTFYILDEVDHLLVRHKLAKFNK